MKKYTFSNNDHASFCKKGAMLFEIMDEKKVFFENCSKKKFKQEIEEMVFKKKILRDIEGENIFLEKYGEFGEKVLTIMPCSYSRDVLNIMFIFLACLMAGINFYILIAIVLLYISFSIINNITRRQQLKQLLNTGTVRVQKLYGIFEYHHKDVIQKKWSENRLSEEEVNIIKDLLCPVSFKILYNDNNIVKYGEEKYLNLIYDLKSEINKTK